MAITTAAQAQQPAAALALLRRMHTANVRTSLLTYNAALGALEDSGRWQQAQRLLRDMRSARVRPSLISYNLALGACAKGKGEGAGRAAMEILDELRTRRMRPDVITYSSVIAALSKGGDWVRVVGLIGAMQEAELSPNAFSFSAAIAACERAGEWEKALALFDGLRAAGALEAMDASVYHSAISAAASGATTAGMELAKSLLEQMATAGFPPDVRAYNGVLKACERAADWEGAIDTLARMKTEGLSPDTISYTCAVGALGRAREWEKALSVWTTMLSEGVAADALALHTLLRALSAASQWQTALGVFDAILHTDDADVCTTTVYAAALEACAVGAQPDRAAAYLEQMQQRGCTPSMSCYLQLASAYAAVDDWRGALATWKQAVKQSSMLKTTSGMGGSKQGGGGGPKHAAGPSAEMYKVVYEACERAGAPAQQVDLILTLL